MSPVHQVWPKPSCKAQWKGEEDKADRGRGGKTTSGNGQAWSLPSPRGQWRTGKNGGNWLWNHLCCPNNRSGSGVDDDDEFHLFYLFIFAAQERQLHNVLPRHCICTPSPTQIPPFCKSTSKTSIFSTLFSSSYSARREAGDVWCLPPVWNLRAVIWFHFAISSLVLLPSPVTLSVLSFSACWPFLLNFFQKILQYFSLRDRLFCMAPV